MCFFPFFRSFPICSRSTLPSVHLNIFLATPRLLFVSSSRDLTLRWIYTSVRIYTSSSVKISNYEQRRSDRNFFSWLRWWRREEKVYMPRSRSKDATEMQYTWGTRPLCRSGNQGNWAGSSSRWMQRWGREAKEATPRTRKAEGLVPVTLAHGHVLFRAFYVRAVGFAKPAKRYEYQIRESPGTWKKLCLVSSFLPRFSQSTASISSLAPSFPYPSSWKRHHLCRYLRNSYRHFWKHSLRMVDQKFVSSLQSLIFTSSRLTNYSRSPLFAVLFFDLLHFLKVFFGVTKR